MNYFKTRSYDNSWKSPYINDNKHKKKENYNKRSNVTDYNNYYEEEPYINDSMHKKNENYNKRSNVTDHNNHYDEEPEIIHVYEAMDKSLSNFNGTPARIKFIPDYLNKEEADNLYKSLEKNINWQQREASNKAGNTYLEPRKTYWFGKPYKYSSVTWDNNEAWNEDLDNLKKRLCEDHPIENGKEYNSVMCNYYRNNKDSIGWHADDETSLGRYPKIASISLGSERVFEVCKRSEYYSRNKSNYYEVKRNPVFNGCTILYRFHLNHGSLLIMEGSVQDEWLHSVPKEKNDLLGRINLTYRHIVNESEEQKEKHLRQNKKRRNSNNNYTNNNGESQEPTITNLKVIKPSEENKADLKKFLNAKKKKKNST